MSIKHDVPKVQIAWAYYNYTLLQGFSYSRRQAVMDVESLTGKTWKESRRYMQIRKVLVQPTDESK
jgi:hypothetical protein